MKKGLERSSMTYALVFYARLGEVSGCSSPLEVYQRIKGACGSNLQLARDVWAVRECMFMLYVNKEYEVIRALKEIYFLPFSRDLDCRISRNKITELVRCFADKNFLDDRTVYRRLHRARQLWLDIRNAPLNIDF